MMSMRVLVVEDEIKIAEVLKDYLVSSGYEVACLDRGDLVLTHVKVYQPDIILLDIMIPGRNGLDVCRAIRELSSVPIIMITARVEEMDRLLGLELGADDYICKPFSPREVVARVNAVLRRALSPVLKKTLRFFDLEIVEESRRAFAGGAELRLTPCEYNLLKVMLASPERIFSRNELVNAVQGYDFEGYDRTIDSHIKNLRKKIAGRLPDKEIIRTIYGVGYKLNSGGD
ncbi:MAG: response regulator [Syntrophobacteraceae bacterium]|nr:response regulator [Syntrophobacteraceae bacterium]